MSIALGCAPLIASCAPTQPLQTPAPASWCAPFCPYPGQPPSQRALWRTLETLAGHVEVFRVVGDQSIGVIEDDKPSTWHALVIEIELVRDSIVGKLSSCTPQNFTTLVAWREFPDSASAMGFSVWTPFLGKQMALDPPKGSGCWFRRAPVGGGRLVRVVDLLESPNYAYVADSGMIRIDRLPSPVGKPCDVPSEWPWTAPGMSCQRLEYNAGLSGGKFKLFRRSPGEEALPEFHTIVFSTWQVPGIRLTIDCMNAQASLASDYCRT